MLDQTADDDFYGASFGHSDLILPAPNERVDVDHHRAAQRTMTGHQKYNCVASFVRDSGDPLIEKERRHHGIHATQGAHLVDCAIVECSAGWLGLRTEIVVQLTQLQTTTSSSERSNS